MRQKLWFLNLILRVFDKIESILINKCNFSVCPNDMEYLVFFMQNLIIDVLHEDILGSYIKQSKADNKNIESKK